MVENLFSIPSLFIYEIRTAAHKKERERPFEEIVITPSAAS